MVVRHNLPLLMAKKRVKSISELSRIMDYDYATLYNFSAYIHKKLDPKLVADLCELFGCSIGDLLYLDMNLEETEKEECF